MLLIPSSADAVLVEPVFIGNCGIGGPTPLARGVGRPGGGYKTISSVPPVRTEAEEARDDGLEPPMAGMALEAALAAILPPPARAGPYELLPLVELLL